MGTHEFYLRRTFKRISIGACIVLIPLISGCGGGSSDSGSGNTGLTIEGSVIAGSVSGATVTLYALSANGVRGQVLGTSLTKSDGSFTVHLPTAPVGAVEFSATGGVYASEADTNVMVNFAGGDLTAIANTITNGENISVTPFTHFSAVAARKKITSSPLSLKDELQNATNNLAKIYGLSDGLDFSHVKPDFSTAATGNAYKMAIWLGIFEQLSHDTGIAPPTVYNALAQDLSDGQCDGMYFNAESKQVDEKFKTLCSIETVAAANSYANNTNSIHSKNNEGKIPLLLKNNIASMVAKLYAHIMSSSVSLSDNPSSGAISTIKAVSSLGTKSLVVVGARKKGLIAVDTSDANVATWKVDALPAINVALVGKNGAFNSIGGVIALNGIAQGKVIVFDYPSSKIAIVDVLKSNVRIVDLDIKRSAVLSSQSSVKVAGGVADTVNGKVWLATADGYLAFDPLQEKVVTTIARATSDGIPEHLAGETSVLNMLLAPYYFGDVPEDRSVEPIGLHWIDLSASTPILYHLQDSEYKKYLSFLDQPSSVAFDISYKKSVIVNALTGDVGFLDLKDKNKYVFDEKNHTFGFNGNGDALTLRQNLGVSAISGITIDSENHLAFLMSADDPTLVVAKLDDPTKTDAKDWKGFSDYRWYKPNFTESTYAGSPHAGGIVKVGATPYGVTYSDDISSHVIFVNLKSFLASTADTNKKLTVTPFGTSVIKIPVP